MRQQIIQALSGIVCNEAANEYEIIRQLKQLVDNAEVAGTHDDDVKSLSELYTDNIRNWQGSHGQASLVKTHFSELDNLLGGFLPGEFIVIGARPSMGKTQLLINLALNMSHVNPVLFCTLDLSAYLLTSRFISTLSNIPIQRILQNDLLSEETALIASLNKQLSEHKIFISGSNITSLPTFRHQCSEQIRTNGVKIIMVDFLQQVSINKFRGSREQEISNFTRELKIIAKENDVVVIATSQLNRSIETRKESKIPQLSDLRDSGSIEQDADKVIFIYRPEYYGITNDEMGETTEGETHLHLAKNKMGKTGALKVMRALNGTTFKDMISDTSSQFDPGGFRNEFSFSQNRINEIRL